MAGLMLPEPAAIYKADPEALPARKLEGDPLRRKKPSKSIPRAPSDLFTHADIVAKISTIDSLLQNKRLPSQTLEALQNRRHVLQESLSVIQARERFDSTSLSPQRNGLSNSLSNRLNRLTDKATNGAASKTLSLSMSDSIALQQAEAARIKDEQYAAMMASLHLNDSRPSHADAQLQLEIERAKSAAMAGFLWHKDSDDEDETSELDFGLDEGYEDDRQSERDHIDGDAHEPTGG